MLREDLGGEDIVYLESGGTSLTMVDREHYRGDDLDADVTLSVHPRHLTIFAASSGELVGHGTREASRPVAHSVGVTHG